MADRLPYRLQKQVKEGVHILKQGGLIAFPTDTVYGLGASAYIREAVERIYRVKQRPSDMALPLLLADISQISEVAYPVPDIAWTLIRAFLPGALTLVLHKADSMPDFVTAGGKTIAIRIPAHPVPVGLARGLGAPLIGTSANISGRPSSLTAEEVVERLGDKVDLVINGGRTPGGIESTIVDVSGDVPVVLRDGAISREELRRVCPGI